MSATVETIAIAVAALLLLLTWHSADPILHLDRCATQGTTYRYVTFRKGLYDFLVARFSVTRRHRIVFTDAERVTATKNQRKSLFRRRYATSGVPCCNVGNGAKGKAKCPVRFPYAALRTKKIG